jgi:peptidyl-tRNA hydrolase, PTH1 family
LHNAGAVTGAELSRRAGTTLRKGRERAVVAEINVAGKRVALAFPMTFMNLSGEAAVALVKRFGIEDVGDVVIVHDELDLEPGTVRVKVGGGLAGHNGLKSIKQHLHSDAFVRVRIGVGKPPGRSMGANHVLRRLPKALREELAVSVQVAADAIEAIAADGADAAMTRFNAR